MTDALLFSYGTLRQREVQEAVFGRRLTGRTDAIAGYALAEVTITDPAVIAASGSEVHPVLVPTPDGSGVSGTVFEVGDVDLAAADDYEVDDYTRVLLPLESGARAWVYVLAAQASTGVDHAG